ncbi:hypothetical protein DICVIV_11666 [Dictyocaulus viviparus]|uniref:G-protein coupled receptors family 1 profile domain-containing protein n=1 Tax=Dictyocaulus viviparus TaxID=29172 RepID=A0A0D8XCK9_DICVI|nr:hypothetical protein DICVIV_11666 [Dictyocaulus viviparus]
MNCYPISPKDFHKFNGLSYKPQLPVKYKNGQQLQLDTQNVLSNRNEPTLRIHIGRKRSLSRHFQHGTSNDSKRILLQQVSPKNLNDREDRQVRVQCYYTGEHLVLAGSATSFENGVSCETALFSRSCKSRLAITHHGWVNGGNKVQKSKAYFGNYRDDVRDISTPSSPHVVRRKLNVKERSRQVVKYVHEQRAARTLSIVVGAFILCWAPFFVFSPLAVLCNSTPGQE